VHLVNSPLERMQQRVDFYVLNRIKPEINKTPMSGIDETWSEIVAKQTRYRRVLDMSHSRNTAVT